MMNILGQQLHCLFIFAVCKPENLSQFSLLVLCIWYMQVFFDSKIRNKYLYLVLKVYLRLLFECMFLFLLLQKNNNYRAIAMLLLLQSLQLNISEGKWSLLSLVFNRFCFPISPRFKKAIALWQSNLETDFFGICASGIAVCW